MVNIYFAMIVISMLAGIAVYFQKDTKLYLRLFPVFLLVTIIVELVGRYLRAHDISVVALYNFFTAFEFLFYMYALKEIIHNKGIKKLITNCLWVYILVVILNALFVQKGSGFTSIPYAIGCLLIVSFCIYYFYELFQLPKAVNLVRQPAFWICSGLLFFYCTSFPIYALLNFLKKSAPSLMQNFRVIVQVLNVFLYSSFTIAFLCRFRTRKSTS
jgi:hypothetical protein